MPATLEYKGYTGSVEFDAEAGILRGEVLNLRDVVTFQGESVPELTQAFRESVDDYLDFCAERGERPEQPLSGRLLVRVPPSIHGGLIVEARRRGMSLNQLVAGALTQVVEGLEPFKSKFNPSAPSRVVTRRSKSQPTAKKRKNATKNAIPK